MCLVSNNHTFNTPFTARVDAFQQLGGGMLSCGNSGSSWAIIKVEFSVQRSLLASRSDSRRARMSPFLTGPLTFLTRVLVLLPMKLTLTCVIPPLEPADKSCERLWELTSLANNFIDGGVYDFSWVHLCVLLLKVIINNTSFHYDTPFLYLLSFLYSIHLFSFDYYNLYTG